MKNYIKRLSEEPTFKKDGFNRILLSIRKF